MTRSEAVPPPDDRGRHRGRSRRARRLAVEVYVGSADLLPRNLDHRVEVVFPVQDARLVRRLKDEILDACLKDTINTRQLLADGSYVLRRPEGEMTPFDTQAHFIEIASG